MVSNPFVDVTPANALVLARGQTDFLKVALKVSGISTPPDLDAFERTDIRAIYDPDGIDVTAQFVTNALAPNDTSDVYNAAHPTYAGAQASPANVGLFHDGTGHVAQKVKVPTTAEITVATARRFRIDWKLKKGNQYLSKTEYFSVSEAGTLVVDAVAITVSEVRAGVVTQMTDPGIEDLIAEATRKIRAKCKAAQFDWDAMKELDEGLRGIIVDWTRLLIFQYDASAYRKVEKLKEGTKRFEFAGTSTKDLQFGFDQVKIELKEWLRDNAAGRRPSMHVVTKDGDQPGPFDRW